MHLLYRSKNFSKAPWKSTCVSVSRTFVTTSFISSIISLRQPRSLGNNREQGLDYREVYELSWYPSWSNSLWQGWICGLIHFPDVNATDPILRALVPSDGISSWTRFKTQHSNRNPNPLANQLWSVDFLTPPTPLIIRQRLSTFLESLTPHKNWCSIHAWCSKISLKHSIYFSDIFFRG